MNSKFAHLMIIFEKNCVVWGYKTGYQTGKKKEGSTDATSGVGAERRETTGAGVRSRPVTRPQRHSFQGMERSETVARHRQTKELVTHGAVRFRLAAAHITPTALVGVLHHGRGVALLLSRLPKTMP